MKNINTASLDCGIDGVNIKFLSEFETEQELYYFQRSNSNRTIKYGLLKKLGLKNGLVEYSIFINLPQTIRNSNIQPYSFVDCTKYMRVYQMLTEQLNDIFDFDISDLKVTGIECSFSYTLRDNTLLQPMLNYICRAFISKNNQLNAFAQEIGRDNYSYIELENQLKRQIANIVENNNTAIEKLQSEINAMKAIKIEDTPEELTVLEQQAQQKMYEMLIKLKPNDTTGRNKRMLGNWVTHADRATALALTKIMLMPDYEKEFSERYKTILSEKIRKPEQIEHEKAVEPILKEMGTKLGKLFMCSFHLKQAMKSYHN